MTDVNAEACAAVVTGASTGIGRACALMLAGHGWRVYAGVRTDSAAEELRAAAGSATVVPVRLDVTEETDIAAVRDRVAGELNAGGLAGLVNNAGTTIPCPVEYLPLADFRRQLEINLTGHLAVTQAFLPLLRRPGGRIVNISSPGAKIAPPFMAPYVAAKSGLEGISGVLRHELRHAGIDVAVIEPGYVSTGMRHKLSRDTDAVLAALPAKAVDRYGAALRAVMAGVVEEAAHGADPDVVARAILHALTSPRPRTRYPAGPRAGRMLLLARLLPDRLLDRLVARMIKLPSEFTRPGRRAPAGGRRPAGR
jgi:NAD(P)-dependent dehydrogenase (short-subunit alcohol dehydrogenase family)